MKAGNLQDTVFKVKKHERLNMLGQTTMGTVRALCQ